MIRKKDPCPCGSGKKYKDCCFKLRKGRSEIIIDPEHERELFEKLEEGFKRTMVEFEEYSRGKDLPRELLWHEFLLRRLEKDLEERWDDEKIGAMSTEEIVEKLKSLHVDFNAEEFRKQAMNALSAVDVAEDYYYTQDFKAEGLDEDFIWLAIIELWKRLLPDRPCAEMVDELIFEGGRALEEADSENALEMWESAWEAIKKIVPLKITSMEDAEEFIPHLDESLLWWCEAYVEEMYEAGLEKQEYLQRLIQFVDEICARFSDSQELFVLERVIKGRALGALGNVKEAEALFETLVREAPWNRDVYLGWGDMYAKMDTPDYEKAQHVYKLGMRNCVTGRAEINEKLKELKSLSNL